MRTALAALAMVALVGCGGAAPTPAPTPVPLRTLRPTPAPTPTTVVSDPVEQLAREQCPDTVPSFYEGCVASWVGLVAGFPDTSLVLCVWPHGHSLIAEPGTEGAGQEVGDDCLNDSWGAGMLTWIVNEGA